MKWKFTKINHIEKLTFDQTLERFYNQGISGLVRENIQNSLDARLDKNKPVKVIIKTGEHDMKDIPGSNEIVSHILSLKGGNEYTREIITDMKNHLSDHKFNYISFEDMNTKGLTGSKYGQQADSKYSYGAYAYATGYHFIDSDEHVEKTRGGSHGVGKIASNAASMFNTMFFANYDDTGHNTLGGTIQLIEHSLNGSIYRSTGYFTDMTEDNRFFPYINENYSSIFHKDTRGLKIIIPFLKDKFNNSEEIMRTICDSFLLAILNKILVVQINDSIIDHENIKDVISSTIFDDHAIDTQYYTRSYLETLEVEPVKIEIPKITEPFHQFHLYLRYDEKIVKGRTGIFRSIGMKIEDKLISGYSRKPYNAILVPLEADGDQFLKSLENESHTKLQHSHFRKEELSKDAKRFINKLSEVIGHLIDVKIDQQNPSEGIMDTSDVLYELDNAFKHFAEKKYSKVNIGMGKTAKTLIKTSDTDETGLTARTKKNKGTGKGTKFKKVKKTFDGHKYTYYYEIPSSKIKRLSREKEDYIEINIEDQDIVEQYNLVNVYITLVDGNGKEYVNEYNLKSIYHQILDLGSKEFKDNTNNGILNVSIKNNKIKLNLYRSDIDKELSKLKFYMEA